MPLIDDQLPAVALVVPAHRGGPVLDACLRAIVAQSDAPDEFVVVADGARAGADPELIVAVHAAGARLVVSEPAGGPSRARNTGVVETSAELLFFVDSDVVLAPDAVTRVRKTFTRTDVDSVFGSYDESPGDPGFTSQYKNLVHHLAHQQANREAATFWGACGAVRRQAFAAVGGFDERYERPCVEDIELGYRLAGAGYRLSIDRDLRLSHLKRWTVRGLLRTDLLDRAVPWSALILRSHVVVDDLGTERRARAQVLLTVAATALAVLRRPAVAAGAMATVLVLDAPVLTGLARLRGWPFAVRSVPWRVVHYLVCALGLGGAAAELAAERAGLRSTRQPVLRSTTELQGR